MLCKLTTAPPHSVLLLVPNHVRTGLRAPSFSRVTKRNHTDAGRAARVQAGVGAYPGGQAATAAPGVVPDQFQAPGAPGVGSGLQATLPPAVPWVQATLPPVAPPFQPAGNASGAPAAPAGSGAPAEQGTAPWWSLPTALAPGALRGVTGEPCVGCCM